MVTIPLLGDVLAVEGHFHSHFERARHRSLVLSVPVHYWHRQVTCNCHGAGSYGSVSVVLGCELPIVLEEILWYSRCHAGLVNWSKMQITWGVWWSWDEVTFTFDKGEESLGLQGAKVKALWHCSETGQGHDIETS